MATTTLTNPSESAAVKALAWKRNIGSGRYAFAAAAGGHLYKIVDLGYGSDFPLVLLQVCTPDGLPLSTTARATSVDTLINDYSLAAV